MKEPAALRPLAEAANHVRRLDDYETHDQLAAAVLAVGDAIEKALRTRLRNDREAPDEERLNALSRQHLSMDEVVRALRTRDLISLEAAGTVHQASAAIARAEEGAVKPRDADTMRTAVDRLRDELGRSELGESVGPSGAATGASAGTASAGPEEVDDPPIGQTEPRGARWMRWLAAAFAAAILLGVTWVALQSGDREYDAAIMAFRAGRLDSASAGFERVLEARPGDVTAMLYLARSYRRTGRPGEAAEVLRGAVEEAPEDADVRRELGHLFMDLDRPVSAVAQYERALEYDPEQPLNWAALIRALRQSGDPRAEQLLRDAPPQVRAELGGT